MMAGRAAACPLAAAPLPCPPVSRAIQLPLLRKSLLAAAVAAVMLWAAPLYAATPATIASGQGATHAPISPDLREIDAWGEHARAAKIMLILFQVATILAASKLMGWLAERVKVPGVIGELLAGVLIGPFLLGSMIQLPLTQGHWAPLFPAPTVAGQWPVNDVVWSLAQFASIILLFVTGLHTDLQQFLKYVGPATLIAAVGLVVPFALGVGVVYLPPFRELARPGAGESLLVPALFVGCILAATSIGITARVLGDIGRLDSPEGVTILGAAVLDDVLGIIALAIVGGIASAGAAGVSFGAIGLVAGKAFGFWIGLTAVVLLLAGPIERVLTGIKYGGAMAGLGLALAFVCSALAESFGLAFIIGAYSVGLGLSRTKMAHTLMDRLQPVADFFVPVFFASLGMLVNLPVMLRSWDVVVFGLAVTAVAIIGKLVGCGAAALPVGFNSRGAYRVGLGMLPRGEVALIVAGIGLSRQIVGEVVFGVSIMMTLITTIVAPILLVPAFAKGGSGRRAGAAGERKPRLPTESPDPSFEVRTPTVLVGDFIELFLAAARRVGWEPSYEKADEEIYLLRNGNDAAQLTASNGSIRIDASAPRRDEMKSLIEAVRRELIRNAESVTVETKMP
jgi:Kef-type K+ transport system membrane component KefB